MGAAAAIAALITALGFASLASAASGIGADGSIHGCYVAKGKKKGTLRLLAAGKRCKKRKHEKPIVWSVQGTPGAAGPVGAQGAQGESGISSAQLQTLIDRINQQDATIASLTATITGLTTTVNGLLTQVGTLTGALNGITNGDLTGVLNKLNGISAANLQSTVAALSAVSALCTRASDLTTFGNNLRTAVSGIALNGIIPAGLTLAVPGLPPALGAFSCPAF
jgi:hypothetical protein